MTSLERAFALLLIALSFVLVYLLQPILAPFLAGMILGYLGDPLVDRLEQLKLNRTAGVLLVFLLFGIVIAATLLIILPIAARELATLLSQAPVLVTWLQNEVSPWMIATFNIDPFNIDPYKIGIRELTQQMADNWRTAGGIAGSVMVGLTQSGAAFLGALGMIALTPVVAFYLMRDWDEIMSRIHSMVPRDIEPTFVQLASECDEVLGAFLRGQLLIMVLLGTIYALGLYLLGLELALLIGLIAGLASIVPYLGFFVGIFAAAIAAFFQFGELIYLVYIAIVFGVGQAMEGTVLTPLLVGDKIGLHPVAVIFAVLAGGQLFGFVGILLALPVAAVIMVFVRHLHDKYLGSELYETKDTGNE